ncbi:hypothetical protein DWC19_32210 [Streptomyces sp. M7]|nr:hypothetical protein DWC19_32210 [Streptomyces sp. M7]
MARLRNTKPKGTGCTGLDPSPVGNDPATPVVVRGQRGRRGRVPPAVTGGVPRRHRAGRSRHTRGSPTPHAGAEAYAVVLGDERIRPRTVR